MLEGTNCCNSYGNVTVECPAGKILGYVRQMWEKHKYVSNLYIILKYKLTEPIISEQCWKICYDVLDENENLMFKLQGLCCINSVDCP